MKPNLHDRLVAAIKKEGGQPTDAVRTSKYTVLTVPNWENCYYFVGRSGALRRGPTVTGSVSISNVGKSLLLQRAEAPSA